MDLNDFRSLFTVLGLLCFLGICFWAYSKHSKSGFDEAAQLPFSEDEDSETAVTDNQRKDKNG
jgi:cytochrome c oxidase cbb3-type subunit 4